MREPRHSRAEATGLNDRQPIQGRDATTILLGIITTLMVLGALSVSAFITFPLLFAVFLLFFIWPLQRWLARHLPGFIAVLLTLVVALTFLFALGGSLAYSGYLITSELPKYSEQIGVLYEELNQRAYAWGMSPRKEIEDVAGLTDRIAAFVAAMFTSFLTTGGFLGLVGVFLALGLVEVPRFQARLGRGVFEDSARQVHGIMIKISDKLHGFMLVRTVTSAATGVLTGLICWTIGLDLAFVWGLLAFLLNYIPTLGSALAVIPPALMAVVQFGAPVPVIGVFAGLTLIQMVIGNYVDPLLQGRWVAISPLVAFFSLVFWGWIGNVPGAVLGVPLTIGLIMTLDEFAATRWIAHLMADIGDEPPAASLADPSQTPE
jgi:predicted PurR-regulated permease PerM